MTCELNFMQISNDDSHEKYAPHIILNTRLWILIIYECAVLIFTASK